MIVLGANSEVAQAFVEKMLSLGYSYPVIYLLSSKSELSTRFAHHIQVKYSQWCEVIPLDLLKPVDYQSLEYVNSELLFCATGYLGLDSEEALYDLKNTQNIANINYARLIPVLNYFAQKMETKRAGTMIVLSSVAGERGRQSNFIYGSAKAGLTAYLSGLRNYMFSRKVHVMTVKPGFMDTKMTEGMSLPQGLTASPAIAAQQIVKALLKKKNVVYVLPVWRYIMLIIKFIPEFIFKRLKL